jgi:hypothetical protein
MGDDEDIEPGPTDESDAFVAGLEAAIAAWDTQTSPPPNPYAKKTADRQDWDEGFHEYCENSI